MQNLEQETTEITERRFVRRPSNGPYLLRFLCYLSRKWLCGGGFDMDFVSEFVEPAQETLGESFLRRRGEVIRTEVAIGGGRIRQETMRDFQDGVSDRQHRPLPAAAPSHMMEPRSEVVVFRMRSGPARLRQHPFQPGIADARPAAEPL